MMRPSLLFSLGLLVACGPASVRGQIDDDNVGGARGAIYDETQVDLGFVDWATASVVISSFPDTCDVVDETFRIELDCEERCEDLVAMADEVGLREREWTLTINLIANNDLDDTYDYSAALMDPQDDEFNAYFVWWDTAPLLDQGACEDACEDGELLTDSTDDGDDGELVIDSVDDGIMAGNFDIEFAGSDALKGSFRAEECDMSDWIWFL